VTKSFAVSWDYLCPFARNAHEHLLAGLEAGAEWDLDFVPFSLGQAKTAEGDPAVFDREDGGQYLWALAAGVTVRDHYPDSFRRVHRALFAARHDQSRDIRDADVIRDVLTEQGLDAEEVFARYAESVQKIRESHTASVRNLGMFGVPTFVFGDRAVFVRLMDRPGEDLQQGLATIQGVLETAERMPTLNEYKFTRIAR
jgi:protein-disulfide isomerase-like protein with CxxC motif